MLQLNQLFFIVVCCMSGGVFAMTQQKMWTYTILGITSNTTDKECIDWSLEVVRVGRGDFAISGAINIGCTITDDEFMIEIAAYRSASGSNQYKLLPFKVAKQTLNEFLDGTYKKMVMESLSKCSNAPQSVDGGPVRITDKVVKIDKCTLSTDALPSHMQAGYYKVLIMGTGKCTYYVEILAEIETKV